MDREFKKNIVKLLSGNLIVQVINLVIQPIITRIYSPADYGVLSLVTSIVSIAGILGVLSYERVIPIVRNDESAISIAKSLLTYIACFTVIVLIGVGFLKIFLDGTYLFSIYFLGVLLFGVSLFDSVMTNLNYKMGNYGGVAKRKVVVAIISAVVQICLGMLGFGGYGLLISIIFCSCVGVYLIGRKYHLALVASGFANKHIFWEYRRLAIIETPQNLINALSIQLPVYFISHYYSMDFTGQYALAIRLISVPVAIITTSFSDVFVRNFAKLYHSNGDYHNFTLDIWKKLILIGLIPTLIIVIGSPHLVVFIFGAKWYMAGQMARILCISSWISLLSGTTLFAFMIMNKGKIMFLYSGLLFVTRSLGMYILIHNLWYGLIFYVASEIIIRLIWIYLLHLEMLNQKEIKINIV